MEIKIEHTIINGNHLPVKIVVENISLNNKKQLDDLKKHLDNFCRKALVEPIQAVKESSIASKPHLHIDTLIGKFVVINIPSDQNRSPNQAQGHSLEDLKLAVESALLRVLTEIDFNEVEKP